MEDEAEQSSVEICHEEKANADSDEAEKFDFAVRDHAACEVVANPFMKDDNKSAGYDSCNAGKKPANVEFPHMLYIITKNRA